MLIIPQGANSILKRGAFSCIGLLQLEEMIGSQQYVLSEIAEGSGFIYQSIYYAKDYKSFLNVLSALSIIIAEQTIQSEKTGATRLAD